MISQADYMLRAKEAGDYLASVRQRNVRLLNTFILGPTMVYASISKDITPIARTILGLGGLFTMFWNIRAYQKV